MENVYIIINTELLKTKFYIQLQHISRGTNTTTLPLPKKIIKYWSYKTNLNVWCSNLRVLLICPCNKDIPKHWPPFEQKATRSIYGCHSHKYKYTIHYNIKPQKQWFKIGECRRIHWTIILPTGSDETLPSAWNAWAVALRSLLTK